MSSHLHQLATEIADCLEITPSEDGRLVYYGVLTALSQHDSINHYCEFTPESWTETHQTQLPTTATSIIESVKNNPEQLETVYEELVPEDTRGEYGQFFTPPSVVHAMASLLPESGYILDPASGTGAFVNAVTEPTQTYFGNEVDPLLAEATRLRASITTEGSGTVFEQDFLTEDLPITNTDAVICNPPYNRFHNHDTDIIENITEPHGIELTKLSNAYPLFLLRALEYLDDGGRAVFITPVEFLNANYGKTIKQYLCENYRIHGFVQLDWDSTVFDALTTACITIIDTIETAPEEQPANEVTFGVSSTPEDIDETLQQVLNNDSRYTNRIQEELNADEKWGQHFRDISGLKYLDITKSLETVASTKRGITTGYNEFYTLSQSEMEDWGIEPKFFVPVLSKAAQAPRYSFREEDYQQLQEDDTNTNLLYFVPDNESLSEPLTTTEKLDQYIEYGEVELNADERYMTSQRTPWYSCEVRTPPPILATTFSRDNMRFVKNSFETRNLAAFHGVYPEFTDTELIDALLGYLNSPTALELARVEKRVYADGLEKFEPGDLEQIPILDVRELSAEDTTRLAEAFRRLDSASRTDECSETDAVTELDTVVTEILENLLEAC